MSNSEGKIFIISAPSGTGKSTLIAELMDGLPLLKKPVSYTTRAPRGEEKNGIDYNFVSVQEFEAMKNEGKFIESAMVYGNFYGTSLETIQEALSAGTFLIKDIDTQGAINLKRALMAQAVLIFVKPPTLEELEKRLRLRSTDSDEVIKARLGNAEKEIKESVNYDHVVVNDTLQHTVDKLKTIVGGYIKR